MGTPVKTRWCVWSLRHALRNHAVLLLTESPLVSFPVIHCRCSRCFSFPSKRRIRKRPRVLTLLSLPEDVLFHVLKGLPAEDILSVRAVSLPLPPLRCAPQLSPVSRDWGQVGFWWQSHPEGHQRTGAATRVLLSGEQFCFSSSSWLAAVFGCFTWSFCGNHPARALQPNPLVWFGVSCRSSDWVGNELWLIS